MKKKIVIFGCKKNTLLLYNSLKKIIDIEGIITISPKVAKKNDIADYSNLKHLKNKLNFYYETDNYSLTSKKDLNTIKKENFDLGFVMGWQRLIPQNILNSFNIGVFGMHGSSENLPKGRGRSPLNWSLIEGRKHFYTNLFKYSPGVDDGDIFDTRKFLISEEDDIESLHYKNLLSMVDIISNNIENLKNNNFSLKRQKKIKPSYYPKRTPQDGALDLNFNVDLIVRHIKAQTRPFSGAFSFYKRKKIIFWKVNIFQTEKENPKIKKFKNGEIVEVFSETTFLVKFSGGLVLVRDFECEKKIEIGEILFTPKDKIKKFKKNSKGFFDI